MAGACPSQRATGFSVVLGSRVKAFFHKKLGNKKSYITWKILPWLKVECSIDGFWNLWARGSVRAKGSQINSPPQLLQPIPKRQTLNSHPQILNPKNKSSLIPNSANAESPKLKHDLTEPLQYPYGTKKKTLKGTLKPKP